MIRTYEIIEEYDTTRLEELLKAHRSMMGSPLDNEGAFRTGNVGVYGEEGGSHSAPLPTSLSKFALIAA
ncbi:hypothetical protein HCR_23180 (plasmid) [Hydrogenimonas cancrithermarum]|uniref:Uncharacterized protein n=1 Tax=Hydrogenimonas cancrithermarum TaxID=2993563 RepID=A0ABM8FNM4_9BACT|nr:hypothetical protein HCR_23180 [Hydrogenimonas cancrithermarum]